MSWSFDVILSVYSGIIPVIAGVFSISKLSYELKLLLIFFFIGLFVDLSSAFLFQSCQTIWIINIFIVIQYGTFMYVFSQWQMKDKIKRYLMCSIPAFVLVCIIVQLYLGSFNIFNQISNSLESIIFAVVSLYTLYHIRQNSETLIYIDFRFWILFGALIYFSGNFLLFSIDYLIKSGFLISNWIIHSVLNITANLCYAGGFLCLRRQ